jgi:hypothetical protein
MMFMDAIHVLAEKGREHGKVGDNIPLKTNAYERCMKVGLVLNPLH